MGTHARVLHRIGAPFSVAAIAAFLSVTGYAFASGTQSGTAISNTATANYSDGTNSYASTSNTVTTTVASVSSENVYLVSSVPGNTTFGTGVLGSTTTYNADGTVVTPQNTITDSYAIQNTGNANAQVTIASAGYGAGGTNNNTASSITATTPAADTAATGGTYTAFVCTSGQSAAACAVTGQEISSTGTVGTAGSFTTVGNTTTTGTLAYAVYTATTPTAVATGAGVPQGGYVLVQFNYNVGTGFSGTNSTVPDGSAAIVGNAGATTSGSGLQIPNGITATDKSYSATNATAAASASFVDQEESDGRLDVLKAASAITNATQPITYTIDGNNGGGNNAKAVDLSAVIGTSLCGTSNTKCIGFAVSDVIQSATNGNAPKVYDGLTGSGEPSGTALAATCPSGLTATVFANTSATPAAGSFTAVTPGTTNLQTAKLLVLICSGTNLINQTLAPNPTSSGYGGYGFTDGTTGAALPTMPATPQIVLTFSTSQATVAASGVTQPNEADSIAQNNAPTSELVGPGTNSGVTPATAGSTGEIAMLDNVTPQPSNGTNAASSGYSNTQKTTLIYQSINLGTATSATATGNFSTAYAADGNSWTSGSATNNGDFSVAPILGTLSGGAYTAANGASTTNAATGVTAATTTVSTPVSPSFVQTFNNGGNAADTFTITATQAATINTSQAAGNATYTPVYSDASGGVCSSPATNTTISAAGVTQSVAAGATVQYCVKYTISGTVDNFDQKAITLTATSNTNASITNSTNDLLIAGGYIQMNKTYVVNGTPSPNDGGTCSNSNPEPGCTINYTIAWSNLAPSGAAGTGNVTPTVSKFTILEDGIANGWFNIASPTTSQTTGILTAATITGDTNGQVAYYATAQSTYNTTTASCYPTTTAASATTPAACTSNTYKASGTGALGSAYGALIYVYGNSITGAVTNGSSGSIAFPLIIRP